MIDLQATDVRTFLPSRDFALSQAFYEALGCEREWADDNLALFKLGPSRFYLQRGYAKEWAENTMLHVAVQDAAACFNAIRALLDTGKYPGARGTPTERALWSAGNLRMGSRRCAVAPRAVGCKRLTVAGSPAAVLPV